MTMTRAAGERFTIDEDGSIAGWAVTFDSPILTWPPTVFRDGEDDPFMMKDRGATDIMMLAHHNRSQPIGRFDKIEVKKGGLWAEGRITGDTQAADEARSNIKKGLVGSFSIGFDAVLKAIWEENPEIEWLHGDSLDEPLRILQKVWLVEISPVTFPADQEAKITEYGRACLERFRPNAQVPTVPEPLIQQMVNAYMTTSTATTEPTPDPNTTTVTVPGTEQEPATSVSTGGIYIPGKWLQETQTITVSGGEWKYTSEAQGDFPSKGEAKVADPEPAPVDPAPEPLPDTAPEPEGRTREELAAALNEANVTISSLMDQLTRSHSASQYR